VTVTIAPARDAAGARPAEGERRFYRRFDLYHRVTHLVLMTSFFGLALTGLPLRFSDARWARVLANAWGGFEAAGFVHRVCAAALIGAFLAHVGRIVHRVYVARDFTALWGPSSMVPQPRDLREMVAHLRWFVGRGPRPAFDHFTYWEKFDYWAVFWGMLIIGGSGLLLWFPAFFSTFLPGWVFNIALLVHGEEALLAIGFIFTIHFFNGHLRPDKFPLDPVIFTGRVSEHDLKEERPGEFARLAREGRLAAFEATPPSARAARVAWIVGPAGLCVGLLTAALIVFALLT
jgi:cytochrome b subunit of formate dehydrogenase